MSAPITKDQLSFSLGNLTYVDSTYDEAPTTVVKPAAHGFGTWVAHRLASLAEWHRRRAVMQEMAMMTDRELSDIGLSRADLNRVFEPSFATEHARGRNYIAY